VSVCVDDSQIQLVPNYKSIQLGVNLITDGIIATDVQYVKYVATHVLRFHSHQTKKPIEYCSTCSCVLDTEHTVPYFGALFIIALHSVES
jgi:hypothetical protein